MWKRIVAAFAVFGMLCLLGGLAAVGYMAVRTLKPESINKGLQRELTALGIAVNGATREEVIARFGPPEAVRDETLSHVLEYPSKGLLLRVNKASGKMDWYEFTSPAFATAGGIRVGATFQQIRDVYGPTRYVTQLSTGTRVRYHYGVAYVLEFQLNTEGTLSKVAFFHS